MDNDTLISLETLEADTTQKEERAALETEGFNLTIVERELVLICSLALRAYSLIEERSWHTETKNDTFHRHWYSWYSHSRRRNASFAVSGRPPPYLGEESLPDVCGGCFHTLGFCVSGRVRFHCKRCAHIPSEEKNSLFIPYSRYTYPNRICYTNHIEPTFAQLIYKYYSPNGDPTWKMKSLIS